MVLSVTAIACTTTPPEVSPQHRQKRRAAVRNASELSLDENRYRGQNYQFQHRSSPLQYYSKPSDSYLKQPY
ncbi:hypothetical protein VNO80_08327 [Phaseolus coccineus]|uniref:Uncharacterized protein n=1 Tax=Phaseolus coccineus TaxID=3886 RepID=A0AAN9RKH0_PHACN